MYDRWSLCALYESAEDPKINEDLELLQKTVEEYKAAVASLGELELHKALRSVIDKKELMGLTVRRLAGFFSLRRSTDASDTVGAGYMTKIQALMASTARENAVFEKFVGNAEGLEEALEKDEVLKEYAFYFKEVKESAKHNLSDEAEEVFAKLSISGGRAWGDLVSYLTANVQVDYKGGTTTLSAIRGLAESEDKDVRREAYEAELACYSKIKDSIAFSLNSIKAQVNTEAELRGFESPLDMTLEQSRMNRATLDAMLSAIREYLPKFREYLRHKAKLLGYENGLPWYELYAPVADADSATFTAEEAHGYLVSHFESFAPDLAEMVDRAFREEWIDFFPREGKVGGAFCSNLPFLGQSRILTNFSGSFGSVVTLAHELGHAYHGQQIEGHRPLNTGYTMPVAETASNFNELIIVNDAIAKAEKAEKIALIESRIQDDTQVIVDIYSRFLFEDEVFRKRKNTFMFAPELEKIMLDAQKAAYGDGLAPEYMHPYMWCCKSHYYSAGLSYYNFPYAFGSLFSLGLYAVYLEEGEAFLPKYRELLKATTVSTVEDVAKVAGIDLTQPDFWKKSLNVIASNIDEFIKETT